MTVAVDTAFERRARFADVRMIVSMLLTSSETSLSIASSPPSTSMMSVLGFMYRFAKTALRKPARFLVGERCRADVAVSTYFECIFVLR